MNALKRESGFILLIFLSLLAYFPEMFFLKQSFLSGDHRIQHYPWAHFLQQSIRQGELPWWTTLFHAGFPILAEGQIGAFYPLNLLFYYFFPLYPAYTYGILFNYFLGALFFYFFLRNLQRSQAASYLGTLVFLFGTAQGGYYYNIISLKVLIWLPLALLLLDLIVTKRKRSLICWLAAVFAFQIFGGYLQYAVYSMGFTSLYWLWLAAVKSRDEKRRGEIFKDFLYYAAAVTLGLLAALPQLGATFELAGFSNRFSYPEEFAFVGSVNPLFFATLFFPHWDSFLTGEIFCGTIGVFLILCSLLAKKNERELFFWIWFVLAVGLALGKYNPLFFSFIKLTGFSALRTPQKFIFFAGFALAVLSSFGVDRWRKGENTRASFVTYTALCGLAIAGLAAANFVFRVFEIPIKEAVRSYIRNDFVKSAVHTKPVEEYLARFELMYAELLKIISPFDRWIIIFIFFLAVSWLVVFLIERRERRGSGAVIVLTTVLYANFYAYGFTTVKGNYEPPVFLSQDERMLDFFKKDDELFRVHRLYESLYESESLFLIPHTNMPQDIALLGAYSPLVTADFYRLMMPLGDVNDSNKMLTSEIPLKPEQDTLLDFLNVKYVISSGALNLPAAAEGFENGQKIFKNDDFLPRVFFVSRARNISKNAFFELLEGGGFEPTRRVYISASTECCAENTGTVEHFVPLSFESYKSQEAVIQWTAPSPGYIVLSDMHYPGWKVSLNGKDGEILKANGMFRAVYLPSSGEYRIRFYYQSTWKQAAPFSAVLLAVLIFLPMAVYVRRDKEKDKV